MRGSAAVLAVAAGILGTACQPADGGPAELGRRTYMGRCIQCHNPNPQLDGTLGPAIAGSSRELVEARVLRAEYPAGYTPKRTTQAMPAQPDLASQIEGLAAYLGSIAADPAR